MNKFMQLTQDFLNDEEGLTLVEYVLGAAVVVTIGLTLMSGFFTSLSTKMGDLATSIGTAGTGS